jgi:hypothetical protein
MGWGLSCRDVGARKGPAVGLVFGATPAALLSAAPLVGVPASTAYAALLTVSDGGLQVGRTSCTQGTYSDCFAGHATRLTGIHDTQSGASQISAEAGD